jgi:hypothetical protein
MISKMPAKPASWIPYPHPPPQFKSFLMSELAWEFRAQKLSSKVTAGVGMGMLKPWSQPEQRRFIDRIVSTRNQS